MVNLEFHVKTHYCCVCVGSMLIAVGAARTSLGQDSAGSDAANPDAAAVEASEPAGLLPLVDYTGDAGTRLRLTGDWGGARTNLAQRGVMADIDLTQTVQGVIAGGRRIDWDYNGSFDAAVTLDLHRMKVLPGALVRARLETRFGETVNDDAGTLLPTNTDGFFPLTSPLNDSIASITELNYVQFLGPKIGITVGKYQTLDGDPNEFASGRGRSQFMNFNFIASGATALTIPYSTLGGGLIVMPTDRITISSIVVATNDSSTTSGFEDLNDGLSWITEIDFQYKVGGLPGGANVGFVYAFSGDFSELGGKLQLGPDGLGLPEEDESWAAFVSAWQYVYLMEDAPDKVDIANGRQDLRGIGVFARLGFGDDQTNPIEWTASLGISAKGLIPSRDHDTMGIAIAHTQFQDGGRFATLLLEDTSKVVEAYYNVAITPAVGLTFDVQWLDGVFESIEEAWIVGTRLDVRF